AHDASWLERAGMLWLVAGSLALGLFPVQFIGLIDRVTRPLVGMGLAASAKANGWFVLAPMSVERASYAPLVFLLVVGASFAFAFLLLRLLYHRRACRAPAWD